MVKRNRIVVAFAVVALLAMSSFASDRHAGITIDLARVGDPAPHRMEAALDFGLVVFSVLVTWSKRLTY